MNYSYIFIVQGLILTFSLGFLFFIHRCDKKSNLSQPFEYIQTYEDSSNKARIAMFFIYIVVLILFVVLNTYLFTKLSEASIVNDDLSYTILPDYGIWMLASVFNSIYVSMFIIDLFLRLFLRNRYRHLVGSFNASNSSLIKFLLCTIVIINVFNFFLITDATRWYVAFHKDKIIIQENFQFKKSIYSYLDIKKISFKKITKNESYSYYKINIVFNDDYCWDSVPLRELNRTEMQEILNILNTKTDQKIEIHN